VWRSNGKTTILLLFLDSLFPETDIFEMLPLDTKQSGDKLLHSDFCVGLFVGEILCMRNSKKDYREKKMEHHSYKIGT
jgi:hypothetical protein